MLTSAFEPSELLQPCFSIHRRFRLTVGLADNGPLKWPAHFSLVARRLARLTGLLNPACRCGSNITSRQAAKKMQLDADGLSTGV